MKPFIYELRGYDPVRVFESVHALPFSLFLDSADASHKNARYSFIAFNPIETFTVKNGVITITNADGTAVHGGDPFALINQRLAHHIPNAETVEGLPPFQGGLAGYFGYDLGRSIETLPEIATDNPNVPDMAAGIYDQVFTHDNETGKSWLITHACSEESARTKQKAALRLFDNVVEAPVFDHEPLDWIANFDACDYEDQIERVIDYIKAGDIFQANISQRFDAELPEGFNPFAHYLRLRMVNAAPFAGFMNCVSDDGVNVQISSASPERFLTVRGGEVETRPIKGTRPRAGDPGLNQFYMTSLENSEKDRAENTMIVDLMRNDLSKVCTAESVEVTGLCELESFARVHHLVSTVKGQLQNDKTAADLLRACFPGGSITGAPKIRAMEIIEEIEPTRRGPYCGAMGYIGFDGTMDSNILIRTLVYADDKVSFQTGGGIVADSQEHEEYQETFHKAEAIFNSFDDLVEAESLEEDGLLALAGGL